jgi:hypothetical protein
LIRFRFWGATQAVKTFNTHEAMMDALESEFLDWKTIFEKLRENGNVLTRRQAGLLGLTSLVYLQQHGTRTASALS